MSPFRHGFHKCLLACALIVSLFGMLFAFLLLGEAIVGKGPAGSLVLGGVGLVLLFLFALIFAFSAIYWRSSKPD